MCKDFFMIDLDIIIEDYVTIIDSDPPYVGNVWPCLEMWWVFVVRRIV